MAKPIPQKKPPSTCSRLCIAAAGSLLLLIPILTLIDPWLSLSSLLAPKPETPVRPRPRLRESNVPTFYDDPKTSYTVDKPMHKWDEKRSQWLKLHPTFSTSENRVLIVTGSQPGSCSNPRGDHLLLRFFKNKVDYCRLHPNYEIFYNNAFLHPKMRSYWAKIPVLRAAMMAHPEAEWLFWIDSDAIFTDMDFEVPFERYEGYNMVVHGWPDTLYQNRSWVSLNAGVFLIRNCEWSMEFLDVWAEMGPMSPNYKRWGQVLRAALKDKAFPDSDDQSALVYQILEGEKRWREKIYVENEYALHGYWIGIVGRFGEFRRKYGEMEKVLRRRRHAEAVAEADAAERGRRAEKGGWRRPFITHFTGCQPCSGDQNPAYEGDTCTVGMEKALNFADDQVLRNYGFVHPDLENSSLVRPLPFDRR